MSSRAENILLQSDNRYKRYAANVERALSTFESVAEWADLISFLSRLHKSLLSTSPPYASIPHKLQISKRLAQGLNPALPNGVHQRTLEVYREIFKLIGPQGLINDLPLWSSGLLPFFQYAAIAVKPAVLDLYETFYLPLGEQLRPASKALALAILPGLEEETGDHFDRVLRLLDRISSAVGDEHFIQSVFIVTITTPPSRSAAIAYLTKRLPLRLKPVLSLPSTLATESNGDSVDGIRLEDVVGPDPGLFVRSLSTTLSDPSLLVRRSTLDLLAHCLPLRAFSGRQVTAFSKTITETDKHLLVRSACEIVLTKDVSLSRRVIGWLLGSSGIGGAQEEDSDKQIDAFREVGLKLVKDALFDEMESSVPSLSEASHVTRSTVSVIGSTRAFKTFISLLDKWEIGYPLSLELAVEALEVSRQIDQAYSGSEENERSENVSAVVSANLNRKSTDRMSGYNRPRSPLERCFKV